VDLNVMDDSAFWLISLAHAISLTQSEPHILVTAPVKNQRLLERIARLSGAHLHFATASAAASEEGAMSPAEAASQLLDLDRNLHADILIARGMQVCAEITKLPSLAHRLWCYVTGIEFPADALSKHQLRPLNRTITASRRVLVPTEDARSYLEATVPAAAGKCLILNPIISDDLFDEQSMSGPSSGKGPLRLVYAGTFAKGLRTLEMCDLPRQLAELGVASELTVIGDTFQKEDDDPAWQSQMQAALKQPSVRWLGGMAGEQVRDHVRRAEIGLNWRSSAFHNSLDISPMVLECAAAGVAPLLNRVQAHEDLFGTDYPFFLEQGSVSEMARVLADGRSVLPRTRKRARDVARWYSMSESVRRLESYFTRAEGDVFTRPTGSPQLRVLLAGHDFQFAGELVEVLESRPDIDLRFDHWRTPHSHDEAASKQLSSWADVVLCERAGHNAVWYSTHKRLGQRLIVRFHLFELDEPSLSSIKFDAIDSLVAVSPLVRQRVINRTGWNADKIVVIPNAVDTRDLDRSKLPGAHYRLGLVGIVPFRKRPDRALAVLKRLIEIDPRFTLHIRGRMPWEYQSVWNKADEREAYLSFFEEFGHTSTLADHVAFEPFGADMASWLRKIGFVLSPSTSESFHLTPAEGMASGSIPILWDRDDVADIFPDRFIVPDNEAAARLILDNARRPSRMAAEAELVKTYVSRFDMSQVGQLWLDHVFAPSEDSTGNAASRLTQRQLWQIPSLQGGHAAIESSRFWRLIKPLWHLRGRQKAQLESTEKSRSSLVIEVPRGRRQRIDADICIFTTLRFPGGNASSTMAEVEAFAQHGLSVRLIHIPVTMSAYMSTRYAPFLPLVVHCDDVDDITCRLAIVRAPRVILKRRFQHLARQVRADRGVFVVNNSFRRPSGESVFDYDDLTDVVADVPWPTKEVYPAGPAIRTEMMANAQRLRDQLPPFDWTPSLDASDIAFDPRPKSGHPLTIGRHARDGWEKWPNSHEDLFAAYPDDESVQILILGGAAKPSSTFGGQLPSNWTVIPFGQMSPTDYLRQLDVFVYFPHPDLNEAFGRTILEAMFAGVPCVLPPRFSETFADLAIFCEPTDVPDVLSRIAADDAGRLRFVRWVRSQVDNQFDTTALLRRVPEFGLVHQVGPVPIDCPPDIAAFRLRVAPGHSRAGGRQPAVV